MKEIMAKIGEETLTPRLEAFPPPERYLLILDILALVRSAPNGKLWFKPRRPEWAEFIPPLLEEANPYKEEIYKLVKQREQKACLHCSHWHPLDDSFGICDLMPGICGRLYECGKFKDGRKTHAGKESL